MELWNGVEEGNHSEPNEINNVCKEFVINIVRVQSLSHVRIFAAPWTVACQAPLSMGFPR